MSGFKKPIFLAVLALALVAILSATQARLIAPAIDQGLMGQDYRAIFVICGVVILVGIIKGFADYAQTILLARIGSNLIAELQAKMMHAAIHADIPQIHGEGSSRFVARFLSDSFMVREATIKSLIGLAKDFLTVIGMIAVMISISWELTLAIIVVFPLSVLPIIWIGRKLRALSHNIQANLGDMTGLLDDFFKSLRIVKAYCAEKLAMRQSQALFDRQANLQYKSTEIRARTAPILEGFGSFAVAAVILLGSWRVSSGSNSTGEIMSFISALLMSYQPIRSLSNLNASLQQGLAAAIRCFEVMDLIPHVREASPALPPPDQFNIKFNQVSFGYADDAPAICELSFEAKAGEMIALVGPSGAGKSTIINLLLRLYDPIKGEILIGDKPISELKLADLRGMLALVSQEPGILEDTIANNIALSTIASKEHSLDMEKVIAAAKAAEADEFITNLPLGYQTRLSEMGSSLSGGQRQRLAIARAIYKDAPILLLDEATSALDSETESLVQFALKRLIKGRTVIVIAHRLSTIMEADRILVFKQGRLVESGNHETLLNADGLYNQLYHIQFKSNPLAVELD